MFLQVFSAYYLHFKTLVAAGSFRGRNLLLEPCNLQFYKMIRTRICAHALKWPHGSLYTGDNISRNLVAGYKGFCSAGLFLVRKAKTVIKYQPFLFGVKPGHLCLPNYKILTAVFIRNICSPSHILYSYTQSIGQLFIAKAFSPILLLNVIHNFCFIA